MKDRWTQITDAAEREALMLHGKWDEKKPTTVRRADALWALIDDAFRAWRADRTGKRLCQNKDLEVEHK